MGVELKTVNPVVFDDPVYCADSKDGCFYLDCSEYAFCGLFPRSKMIGISTDLEIKNKIPLKCQECKVHYLKNKK